MTHRTALVTLNKHLLFCDTIGITWSITE